MHILNSAFLLPGVLTWCNQIWAEAVPPAPRRPHSASAGEKLHPELQAVPTAASTQKTPIKFIQDLSPSFPGASEAWGHVAVGA